MNYHKTGMVHKKPVLGMIERKGKIIVRVLDKAWGKEIKPIMRKKIAKNSAIVTDGFGGYKDLDLYFDKHIKLNRVKYLRKIGKYHTNTIEGFWSMLKRAIIGQYHQVSSAHLQGYLDEIAFKYNYRNRKNNFNLLVTRSLNTQNAVF